MSAQSRWVVCSHADDLSVSRVRVAWAMVLSAILAVMCAMEARSRPRSANVEGHVVDAVDSSAVSGAVVTIAGSDLSLRAVTDDAGGFVFADLPPGRFRLTVVKSPYLPAEYGQRIHSDRGTLLALGDDQARVEVSLRMWRGGVIAGTIMDFDGGGGAPNVAVFAESSAAEASVTNDRGEFRLFGLPPGEYVIRARPRSGRAVASVQPTRSQIDRLLAELTTGVGAVTAEWPDAIEARGQVVVGDTFFPGTAVEAEAVPVKIGLGETRSDLVFGLAVAGSFEISGAVQMSRQVDPPALEADPADVAQSPISVVIERQSVAGVPSWRSSTSAGRPNGVFEFRNLPAGLYTISASAVSRRLPSGEVPNPRVSLWGRETVRLDSTSLSGIRIELRPVASLAGRVVVQAADQGDVVSFTGTRVRLGLTTIDGASSRDGPTTAEAVVSGSFSMDGIRPGRYRVSAEVVGNSALKVRSVLAGSVDLLDSLLVLDDPWSGPGEIAILVSQTGTRLEGAVRDLSGTTTADYTVVVFPAEPALRSAARRLAVARPDTAGRFVFSDLPEGNYFVAVATVVSETAWQDPGFFDRASAAAVAVRLLPGRTVVCDLTLAR